MVGYTTLKVMEELKKLRIHYKMDDCFIKALYDGQISLSAQRGLLNTAKVMKKTRPPALLQANRPDNTAVFNIVYDAAHKDIRVSWSNRPCKGISLRALAQAQELQEILERKYGRQYQVDIDYQTGELIIAANPLQYKKKKSKIKHEVRLPIEHIGRKTTRYNIIAQAIDNFVQDSGRLHEKFSKIKNPEQKTTLLLQRHLTYKEYNKIAREMYASIWEKRLVRDNKLEDMQNTYTRWADAYRNLAKCTDIPIEEKLTLPKSIGKTTISEIWDNLQAIQDQQLKIAAETIERIENNGNIKNSTSWQEFQPYLEPLKKLAGAIEEKAWLGPNEELSEIEAPKSTTIPFTNYEIAHTEAEVVDELRSESRKFLEDNFEEDDIKKIEGDIILHMLASFESKTPEEVQQCIQAYRLANQQALEAGRCHPLGKNILGIPQEKYPKAAHGHVWKQLLNSICEQKLKDLNGHIKEYIAIGQQSGSVDPNMQTINERIKAYQNQSEDSLLLKDIRKAIIEYSEHCNDEARESKLYKILSSIKEYIGEYNMAKNIDEKKLNQASQRFKTVLDKIDILTDPGVSFNSGIDRPIYAVTDLLEGPVVVQLKNLVRYLITNLPNMGTDESSASVISNTLKEMMLHLSKTYAIYPKILTIPYYKLTTEEIVQAVQKLEKVMKSLAIDLAERIKPHTNRIVTSGSMTDDMTQMVTEVPNRIKNFKRVQVEIQEAVLALRTQGATSSHSQPEGMQNDERSKIEEALYKHIALGIADGSFVKKIKELPYIAALREGIKLSFDITKGELYIDHENDGVKRRIALPLETMIAVTSPEASVSKYLSRHLSEPLSEQLRESEAYDQAVTLSLIQKSISDATMQEFLDQMMSAGKQIVNHIIPSQDHERAKEWEEVLAGIKLKPGTGPENGARYNGVLSDIWTEAISILRKEAFDTTNKEAMDHFEKTMDVEAIMQQITQYILDAQEKGKYLEIELGGEASLSEGVEQRLKRQQIEKEQGPEELALYDISDDCSRKEAIKQNQQVVCALAVFLCCIRPDKYCAGPEVTVPMGETVRYLAEKEIALPSRQSTIHSAYCACAKAVSAVLQGFCDASRATWRVICAPFKWSSSSLTRRPASREESTSNNLTPQPTPADSPVKLPISATTVTPTPTPVTIEAAAKLLQGSVTTPAATDRGVAEAGVVQRPIESNYGYSSYGSGCDTAIITGANRGATAVRSTTPWQGRCHHDTGHGVNCEGTPAR